MTQHQLDRPEVDSFRQQSARTLVPEVVPVQVDPC